MSIRNQLKYGDTQKDQSEMMENEANSNQKNAGEVSNTRQSRFLRKEYCQK